MPGRDILTLDLVDGSSSLREELSGRQRPARFLFLGVSLAFQGFVLGIVLLRSMTAEAPIPEPQVVKTFMALSPVTRPAPPPPPAAVATPVSEPRSRPRPVPPRISFEAPPPLELDFGATELDIVFGAVEGIDAGVPGGVIGGLVGGLEAAPTRPPAPVVSRGPIRITGTLGAPEKRVHVDPVYPDIAVSARVEGLVILEATVDGAGKVKDLRVLKSIPLLDDAAVAAVRQWEYAPTIVGGSPVPILMTVTVSFSLA